MLLLFAATLAAQDDVPVSEIIDFDLPVSDNLTERAFYDWWRVEAEAGDVIVADMQAQGPLEPLLGILAPDGTLLARSDDGVAGGKVTLEYKTDSAGEYTIVATRVGNENGTSTGDYNLLVRRANDIPQRVNPYQEVVFRCQNDDATNVATLELQEDAEQSVGALLISVYGMDGFSPVIRVSFENVDLTDCSHDALAAQGNVIQLPGEAPVTLEDNLEGQAAQLVLSSMSGVGHITLNIGSLNGASGRYVAVIHGLSIVEEDHDLIRVGQGPLAASAPLLLYMVAEGNSRLDPSASLSGADDGTIVCDDAGRRGCDGVPSAEGLFIHIAAADLDLRADRFDAGVALAAGPPRLRNIDLGGFDDRTTGPYALVLMGELPPRS